MFLSDTEIHQRVTGPTPIITGLDLTNYVVGSAADPVQAASVDLTIGGIFDPGAEQGKLGSAGHPLDALMLERGGTAVIQTEQSCHLPPDVGAIGFPPASVAKNGLLTTNPGHVDPGYHGKLSFTVINMGRQPCKLGKGNTIVSLMLFELAADATAPYDARHGAGPHGDVSADRLSTLSHDFLDINERAKEAAQGAESKTRRWGLVGSIAVALLAIVGGYFQTIRADRKDVRTLEQKVTVLESKLDLAKLEARIKELEAGTR